MSTISLPAGACDCHTHVFEEGHSLDPARSYTPGPLTAAKLLAHLRRLGLDRVVLVQPSTYGTDNAGMERALAELGPLRARGIAVIDETTEASTLRRLHTAGVRGVRINLHTAGRADPGLARALLTQAAARVAPLGWHVQVYTELPVIEALAVDIANLPCGVVVDHFGRAHGAGGAGQPGFAALVDLLRQGLAHVKLSASHRLSSAPDAADMAPIARALIAANPARVIWASDFPHSGVRPGLTPEAVHPFQHVDDARALARLAEWAGDAETLRRILVENPSRLYDF
jgi:predicted TIM-barrel fold metal-dependent hydrolase